MGTDYWLMKSSHSTPTGCLHLIRKAASKQMTSMHVSFIHSYLHFCSTANNEDKCRGRGLHFEVKNGQVLCQRYERTALMRSRETHHALLSWLLHRNRGHGHGHWHLHSHLLHLLVRTTKNAWVSMSFMRMNSCNTVKQKQPHSHASHVLSIPQAVVSSSFGALAESRAYCTSAFLLRQQVSAITQ